MADAQNIGSYRLERVLGTGSFATVWLANDEVLDREVAVKVLADNWSRDLEVRRRFLSEARVLLTVESPRIVRGFHIGETDAGQPYLVMAWADRGTLDDRLRQREREDRVFSAQETVGVATEVADALVDVHASGHLHRDVKPTNVLIRSTSTPRHIPGLAPDETIVLGDFGLARGLDLTAVTLVAGSPGYVAPEQAAGLTQIDRRADLYSLGRIMLQLLTGDAGGRATTMAAAASETIDVGAVLGRLPPAGVSSPPDDLVDLITRLVATRPDARPSSAEEVSARLGEIARSFSRPFAPPVAPPTPSPSGLVRPTGTQLGAAPPRSGRGRSPKALGLAAAALLAVAVVIALASRGGGGTGASDSTTPSGTRPIVVVDSSNPTRSEPAHSVVVITDGSSTASAHVADSTEGPGSTDLIAAPSIEPAPAADSIETTSPATTAEPSGTASASPSSSDPATGGDQWSKAQVRSLVLPAFAFGDTGATPNPDVMTGSYSGLPSAFVDGLLDANPTWSAPSVPEADATDDFEFELRGTLRSATVTAKQDTSIIGRIVTAFTIEYHE